MAFLPRPRGQSARADGGEAARHCLIGLSASAAFKIASAMRAASTAGRTSWTRTMAAPARMAAVTAASVGVAASGRRNGSGRGISLLRKRAVSACGQGSARACLREKISGRRRRAAAGPESAIRAGGRAAGNSRRKPCRSRSQDRERCGAVDAGGSPRGRGPAPVPSVPAVRLRPPASGGSVRHSDGRPRVCMRMTPQRSSAQVASENGIPEKSRDVVDDLGARCDRGARGLRVIRVDRENSPGPPVKDRFDHGQDAVLFFLQTKPASRRAASIRRRCRADRRPRRAA